MDQLEWDRLGSGGRIVSHCPFEDFPGARRAEFGEFGVIGAAPGDGG